MKLITLLYAGCLILLFSCASARKTTIAATPLYETKWLLKKIHSEAGVEDVTTKAFIKFDELKKSAAGNGSCNSFGSSTTINKNELSLKNIFSTKMYCEGVQKTEDNFLSSLGKITRYEVKENRLNLFNGNELSLEFIAE